MSEEIRNLYGTPDDWLRFTSDGKKPVDPFESDYNDEDWLGDLKAKYRTRADKESAQWVKDHSDDFFKEGEDLYNLEDEYNKKRNEGLGAFGSDKHATDLKLNSIKADSYSKYADKQGWRGTAAKQRALRDQYNKESEDYKKTFINDYIGQDLNDRYTNKKHPMMDELNTINSNIEKEFNDEVNAKRKGFEDALNGRDIFFGMTGKGSDSKWDYFLENPSVDPGVPKTYKRIGQRKFSKFPWGPNRGWEEFMAYPDPTQEFDDVSATDIRYLQKHKGLNDYQKVGERDSTD